ncbi:MAG: glycosyltransferase [Burkholderiales bacterium]|nr:glycosyltransferase [Burkholderiales bacterium]
MALTRVLLFTRNQAEGRAMLPLARFLADSGLVEGMALVATPEEWAIQENPLIHRFYEEFSLSAPQNSEAWLLEAIKRALVEEKAQVAVFPNGLPPFDQALEFCWMLEGIRTLVWPDQPLDQPPEWLLRTPPDALGLLDAEETQRMRSATEHQPANRRTTMLTGDWQVLRDWLLQPPPAFHRVPLAPRRPVRELMWAHLEELALLLPEGECLVLGPEGAAEALQELAPRSQVRAAQTLEGSVDCVVDLLHAAAEEDPGRALAAAWSASRVRSLHLLPVNMPLAHRSPTFRYGDYDNEFALGPASHDLRSLARAVVPPERIRARVLGARGGGRPLWQEPWIHAEAPDGALPMFLLRLEHEDLPPEDWLERFRLPDEERMRVVFVDSQNIAGSVLNHAVAVNRHTPHRALALCRTRHPYIGYPQEESRAVFVDEGISQNLLEELEAADCFVFFEDDDEETPLANLDLRPFVQGRRVVHLYIGQRVHRDVARHQRPGRMVLTPLPHLLRIFPQAYFYAGFPPTTLEDVELRPPLSEEDGIVRILQTPSLPHPTLSRFYYHKDTETYLHATRELCRRKVGRTELWQVAGWPHHDVMQARLDCDVTFNQLRGYHGLSGDEAMFLGRPVVQAFDQFNINRHLEYWGLDVEFPWISTTPDLLAQTLADLVADPKRRKELGIRCRRFMLDYFSPRVGILPLLWYCRQAPTVPGDRSAQE